MTPRTSLAGLAVLSAVTISAAATPAAAVGAHPRPVTDPAGLPTTVSLDHPVSVAAALPVLEAAGGAVRELRLAAEGTSGGLVPFPGVPPRQQADMVVAAYTEHFGQTPVVTGVRLAGEAGQDSAARVVSALARASPAVVDRRPATTTTTTADAPEAVRTVQQAQGIPAHFPSRFYGEANPYVHDGVTYHGYEYWFQYRTFAEAYPGLIPEDWGMELGITSRNSALSGIRPVCTGGDAFADFWSSSYEAGGLYLTDVPDSAGFYIDDFTALDECRHNSVEVGIGYPRELEMDENYLAFVALLPGTLPQSPAWAEVGLVSNDCNDVGAEPQSTCMGLNVGRELPFDLEQVQSYVNVDRGWTIPGCVTMDDGLPAPILHDLADCSRTP